MRSRTKVVNTIYVHCCTAVYFINIMESITSLKECILADEIQRIESLSKEILMQELVDLTAERLESLSLNELTTYQQNKHEQRK